MITCENCLRYVDEYYIVSDQLGITDRYLCVECYLKTLKCKESIEMYDYDGEYIGTTF